MVGAIERTIVGQPIPTAGGRVIVSPFQFQTTGEDNLRVDGWSSVAGAVLVVQGRRFDEAGVQQPYSFKVALTSDRVVNTALFPLGKGYLVNMVAFIESAGPLVGQVFCSIKLVRGLTGATIVLGTLIQGYVTAQQSQAWPGSVIADSISGGGVLRHITGTDPAAGSEISETVPTGARWELLSMAAIFVTAGGGINRWPRFIASSAGKRLAFTPVPSSQPPATTENWFWGANFPSLPDDGFSSTGGPFPQPLILLAGATFGTSTGLIAGGDNWTAPDYTVREFLEAT